MNGEYQRIWKTKAGKEEKISAISSSAASIPWDVKISTMHYTPKLYRTATTRSEFILQTSSHFVKPGNAMDVEASIRGTTVYLVDKRIDMLPMLLGTDLCSLKPYVERYAFSTIWEITPNADIVSATFTKSVIRSREAFSYEQAQLRIDDASQKDELTAGMRILLNLSKKLKQKRMDAGALNLASPEVRIQTESETSDPVDVKTKQLLDTNSLVEEFMLLANITVASQIYTAFPQTALLRRHPAPPIFQLRRTQQSTQSQTRPRNPHR